MTTYILRRLLLMVPTLLGVTMVVFFVMALSPGGIGGPMLSEGGEMQARERQAMRDYYRQRYGLDDPLVVQYLRWLNRVSPVGAWSHAVEQPAQGFGFVTGRDDQLIHRMGLKIPDLGESMAKRRPITSLYAEALPITLLLNIITLPIVYGLSIVIGLYAARRRGGLFDITSGITTLGLHSIPENWAGVLLIGFFASAQYWQWFPAGGLHSLMSDTMPFLPHWSEAGFQTGWLLDALWHLILPILVLTYGSFAVLSKITRGSMLESLSQDYIRTARAKGLDERTVLFRHGFRNSLLPLITIAAGIIPGLLGGAIIVETIFSINGMGKLMVEAVFARDRELVLAGALIGGVLGLLCRLISDVCYTIADPRVSYE